MSSSEAILHDRCTILSGAEDRAAIAEETPLSVGRHPIHRQVVDTRLRDGTPVRFRPITPEDRDRLAQGLRWLSPRSRYLRFHTVVDELSDEQLRYFTEIDYCDHMAWLALDLGHPERPGMGVARYVRLEDEPHVAEAAITVVDHYQGRGLGTLLLGLLARTARESDVEVFRNYVLDDNAEMLEVFDHLGATRRIGPSGVWAVDLRVPAADEELPDSPAGRVFVEMARRRHVLDWRLPAVWNLRWRHAEGAPEQFADPPPAEPSERRERDDLASWLDEALEE